MAVRKRRFRKSFAGSKQGRRFFWLRSSPTAVTQKEAANAVHADIILSESDYLNLQEGLNETQRGGALLERVIMDYGVAVQGTDAFFNNSGDGNIASIPEFMLWQQNDQFGTEVTSSASFDLTRNNSRVIMNEIPNMESNMTLTANIRTVRGRFETKSKVRLADKAIGLAWRGFYDEGSVELLGFTDWARITLLVSMP